ncbi:hypothetical protein M0813_28667 [Anaeramoeba flamelloides]|uniref:MHD domain-containing protein n=1 Tax=Anaeramoeba flamelloides TaxID=1746091 RepID=A0ABQ8XS03_9EUKA|nr:hypothetical protein M0813_28667 [Anaeramoeba flamelloides]
MTLSIILKKTDGTNLMIQTIEGFQTYKIQQICSKFTKLLFSEALPKTGECLVLEKQYRLFYTIVDSIYVLLLCHSFENSFPIWNLSKSVSKFLTNLAKNKKVTPQFILKNYPTISLSLEQFVNGDLPHQKIQKKSKMDLIKMQQQKGRKGNQLGFVNNKDWVTAKPIIKKKIKLEKMFQANSILLDFKPQIPMDDFSSNYEFDRIKEKYEKKDRENAVSIVPKHTDLSSMLLNSEFGSFFKSNEIKEQKDDFFDQIPETKIEKENEKSKNKNKNENKKNGEKNTLIDIKKNERKKEKGNTKKKETNNEFLLINNLSPNSNKDDKDNNNNNNQSEKGIPKHLSTSKSTPIAFDPFGSQSSGFATPPDPKTSTSSEEIQVDSKNNSVKTKTNSNLNMDFGILQTNSNNKNNGNKNNKDRGNKNKNLINISAIKFPDNNNKKNNNVNNNTNNHNNNKNKNINKNTNKLENNNNNNGDQNKNRNEKKFDPFGIEKENKSKNILISNNELNFDILNKNPKSNNTNNYNNNAKSNNNNNGNGSMEPQREFNKTIPIFGLENTSSNFGSGFNVSNLINDNAPKIKKELNIEIIEKIMCTSIGPKLENMKIIGEIFLKKENQNNHKLTQNTNKCNLFLKNSQNIDEIKNFDNILTKSGLDDSIYVFNDDDDYDVINNSKQNSNGKRKILQYNVKKDLTFQIIKILPEIITQGNISLVTIKYLLNPKIMPNLKKMGILLSTNSEIIQLATDPPTSFNETKQKILWNIEIPSNNKSNSGAFKAKFKTKSNKLNLNPISINFQIEGFLFSNIQLQIDSKSNQDYSIKSTQSKIMPVKYLIKIPQN